MSIRFEIHAIMYNLYRKIIWKILWRLLIIIVVQVWSLAEPYALILIEMSTFHYINSLSEPTE